ncbi:MBL fold metallo-hydrolase [Christiangramia sabulilitoris]|uniref:beta-lactamase n=1 Tax=Christiangramia sabulilitoris TaxID=2583991 RepID=A0A550I361_9FLAO|nr:MBL fold metallo-hydrolase [Christiangramia sabulilitoris]TRO65413.1 MBL fold metallo-hydrolase [Christiangramia sabulilitoris]
MKTYLKAFSTLIIMSTSSLFAFQNMQDVTIEVIPVNDNIYMLKGAGGNIGVLTGKDGVFMVDDQFAPLTEKIKNAIGTISNEPIRFLINTHHHGDHTGGNTNFKNDGALLMAHENVRKRLNKEDTDQENNGLPVLTFNYMMNLHINKNDIVIAHVHNAHTDGDALIYFPQSNVLHTGDTFFNGMFPYIDLESGGSVDGYIKAAETGISMINENTKIIPGHGAIANKSEYEDFLNMLKTIRENVQTAIEGGASEAEIIKNEELSSEFFTDQEASEFFINGPKIRSTFYKSLKK